MNASVPSGEDGARLREGPPATGGDPAEAPLVALREELTLHPGPVAADGAPTWSLQDPVRNAFFRIDWPTFEILSRWSAGSAQRIVDWVNAETPLDMEADDVLAIQRFLQENQLCQLGSPAATALLLEREAATHSSPTQWLLHHYLFFRLPLVRPDAWLKRLLPVVEVFYGRGFYRLTGIALLVGLVEVYRQWDAFSATLVDTLSWKGAAGYAVALLFVKVLHELGHGFTARRMGCRVPAMGVAFLVMWPVAYTDVNEAWKLTDAKKRLAVGAAGIVTESVVAAWATLAWALLPEGTLRGLAFMLATVTWISTLAINASPFMRFDGYFLLSDWLNFPNLHSRAFAMGRWDLRERLFGLGEEPPEHFTPRWRRGLVLFAWAIWIYRLTLFLGIAAMVYYMFFKALGLFLFAVEIGWFVLKPLWGEIKEWIKRRDVIRQRPRARRTAWLAVACVLLGLVPWNFQVSGQGVLRTARHYPLFAPGGARVLALPVAEGAAVKAGTPLLELESPEIEHRTRQAGERLERLGWQVQVAGFDDSLRARQLVTQEELSAAGSEHAGAGRERERYVLSAPFDGVLRDLRADLRPGEWVNRQEPLAVLTDPGQWQVETYLTESEVARVAAGDGGRFFPETRGLPRLPLEVASVDRDATRQLSDPLLASNHGGELMVRERRGQLVPEHAVYRVVLRVTDPEAARAAGKVQRGQVVVYGTPKTLLGDFLRAALAVLIRESGW